MVPTSTALKPATLNAIIRKADREGLLLASKLRQLIERAWELENTN